MNLRMRLLLTAFTLICVPATNAVARHPEPSPHVVLAKTPSQLKMPTAVDVYNRSLMAEARYSYRGHQITTYWRTGRAIRVLITHLAPNWRRIEYIAPDRLRGNVLISDGRQEWRYDASSKWLHRHPVAADKPSPQDIPVKYSQLRANYDLAFMPKTQVYADRKTFVLTVTRKSDHVLARKMWIDAATGLVLKREAYSDTGKMNVTVAFSDIDYHAKLTRAAFTPPGSQPNQSGIRRVKDAKEPDHVEQTVPVKTAARMLGGAAFAPRGVDEFRLTSAAIVSRPGKKPVLHLRYTDGLVLVSVFEQTRTQTKRPTRVPSTMKPVAIGKTAGHLAHHASVVTVNWDTPILNMTMIGEVSDARMLDLAADFGDPTKIHR